MQLVSPEISLASLNEKPILRNLMELYQHDFSEYDLADVNQAGQYDYPYLDLYWREPNRFPFLTRMNDKLAGFVLVNQHADPVYHEQRWSMAEFFVMRKYRRMGIGTQVAIKIFDKFPGRWQVAQIENNLPARKFWQKVIGDYTRGTYKEVPVKHDQFQGIIQFFDNSLREVT